MDRIIREMTLILITLLAITMLIMSYFLGKRTRDLAEAQSLVSSLNAEIIQWKDRDSLNHSKIEVIETQRVQDFINLKSKDTEIQKLQTVVKQYQDKLKNSGNSVTNFGTYTIVDKIIKIDTVASDCSWNFEDSDKWITTVIDAKAVPNSDMMDVSINYKIRNEYSVIIGSESQGLFKKSKPFVEVINYNPYSETSTLRTYQVSNYQKPKRFSLSIQAGYGGLIDLYHKQIGYGFYIGIGGSFNLINF